MTPLTIDEILVWLRETRPRPLRALFDAANSVRQQAHGDEVHLRGLLHLGNRCRRFCHYCRLRQPNLRITRYQLTPNTILRAVDLARRQGCHTVVLQGGEAEPSDLETLPKLLKTISDRYMPAITLSLGEHAPALLQRWYDAGARRYLIKFETSDNALYHRLHPPHDKSEPDRVEILKTLRRIGYEIGSGMIVGLPGQTWESLAHDLLLGQRLDLDMIAVGPWIPHPDTPLGRDYPDGPPDHADQVPNFTTVTLKALALARLLCPEANIPATTALSQTAGDYTVGLTSGANVLMLDVTPASFGASFALYPGQVVGTPSGNHTLALRLLRRIGRSPSSETGGRKRLRWDCRIRGYHGHRIMDAPIEGALTFSHNMSRAGREPAAERRIMAEPMTYTQGRSREGFSTEWELDLPDRSTANNQKATPPWRGIAKTVGLILIIVGVLYPFGFWMWNHLSDWVMSSLMIHLGNLETHLRAISGVRWYYPT